MPNTFVGKGNLGTAPVLKTVRVGGVDRKVAEVRVFFDEYYFDDTKQEYVQEGGFWMQVSQWDERGEEAARLLRQGYRVKVEGRLREFMYTVEGTDIKVPGFQIIADDITLCLNRIESITAKPKRERNDASAPATA